MESSSVGGAGSVRARFACDITDAFLPALCRVQPLLWWPDHSGANWMRE
jgi:hypothetical protein